MKTAQVKAVPEVSGSPSATSLRPPRIGELSEGRGDRGDSPAVDDHHRRDADRRVLAVEIHQRPWDPLPIGRDVLQPAAFALEARVEERIRSGDHVGLAASGGELGLEAGEHLLAAGLVPVDGDLRQLLLDQRLERVDHRTVHRGVDPDVPVGRAPVSRPQQVLALGATPIRFGSRGREGRGEKEYSAESNRGGPYPGLTPTHCGSSQGASPQMTPRTGEIELPADAFTNTRLLSRARGEKSPRTCPPWFYFFYGCLLLNTELTNFYASPDGAPVDGGVSASRRRDLHRGAGVKAPDVGAAAACC